MTAFEKTLRQLMDYQRFENGTRLEALIEDTLSRCGEGASPLMDEELNLNAAGDPDISREEGDSHE